MTPSLEGRRIVVTRSVAQSASLIEAIETAGGDVVPLPLLEIRDAADGGQALRVALSSLSSGDWLAVLSPNGAARVVKEIPANVCKLATIGSGTASAFRDAGWAVDLVPDIASSEGLVLAFDEQVSPARVIIAQAEGGRTVLADGLRDRGFDVDVVIAYRNQVPLVDPKAVEESRTADTVVFASPSAVSRYLDVVGTTPIDALCIGSVTERAARAAGFNVTVAAEPTVEAILDRLVT